MDDRLNNSELKSLIRSVFSLRPQDGRLGILVDFPDEKVPDNEDWRARRSIARDWCNVLQSELGDLYFKSVQLLCYPNVHSNNADLPEKVYPCIHFELDWDADTLIKNVDEKDMQSVLSQTPILMAPTEFSATAPLKLMSKKLGCRAATMPGFSRVMIPALRLDYEEINRRVNLVKNELDQAVSMDIQFIVDDSEQLDTHFDLRYRPAHASGGRFPDPGFAGNLPSGECYIVPYEGEKGEPSQSRGIMPVQFGDEVVKYRIENNRAQEILSDGSESDLERKRINDEPAYSNIAELGFGVLKDFGLTPIGEILLDEKLGLHIAFGRSDHFGGAVGVKDFTSPENVVHIDRIYIPETQPRIKVPHVKISFEDNSSSTLMENGKYTIF